MARQVPEEHFCELAPVKLQVCPHFPLWERCEVSASSPTSAKRVSDLPVLRVGGDILTFSGKPVEVEKETTLAASCRSAHAVGALHARAVEERVLGTLVARVTTVVDVGRVLGACVETEDTKKAVALLVRRRLRVRVGRDGARRIVDFERLSGCERGDSKEGGEERGEAHAGRGVEGRGEKMFWA